MTENTTTTSVTENLTEEADAAAIEKANHLAESAAKGIFKLFDEDSTTFARAKSIMRWVNKGADVKLIAEHLSAQRAVAAYPAEKGYTDEERKNAAENAPSKGGVRIADSTIRAYVNAWGAVYDAHLVPTEENVAWAFKVKSKGRTAQPLKALIESVKESIDGGASQEEGSDAFVLGARGILTGRVELPEGKARGGKKDGEEENSELSADVPMSLEVAIHNLKVIFGQEWTENERALLAAAAMEQLDALTTVEV